MAYKANQTFTKTTDGSIIKELTFGSLFAGIGGFDLGLERAGMICKWQVEKDEWCRKVLAKHWKNVRRYEDVREVEKHNLESVDVLCGGFPCQDISTAGNQEGIMAKRSGLWFEFYRIICELRPRFVIVENVSALLNQGMSIVCGNLAQSGYNIEWESLSAANFGGEHIRERVFIVAYTDSIRQPFETKHRTKQHTIFPSSLSSLEWCKDGNKQKGSQKNGYSFTPTIPRTSEPAICGTVDGIPCRVDRLRGLGNAVVPQVAEFIGRLIVEANNGGSNSLLE